jgi:dephospho-CoA kinase
MHPALVIVGRSGSGKTYLVNALRRHFRFTIAELEKIVLEQHERSGSHMTPVDYADHAFAEHGKGYFAAIAARRHRPSTELVVFVGPRRIEELALLKASFDVRTVIAVDVDPATRMLRRTSAENPLLSKQYLLHRDSVEEAWGIGATIAAADISLESGADPLYCATIWMRQRGDLDETE